MRLNFILFVFMLFGLNLSAQVQFGVKAFTSTSYASEIAKEFVNLEPLAIHKIAHKGASDKKGLGMSMYMDNDRLFLMSDLQYTTSSNQFALQSVNYSRTLLDPEVIYNSEQEDLRVSLIAGVKINDFKLGVGPEWSRNLTMTEELSTISEITYNQAEVTPSFSFLAGYVLMDHLHIDVKYTYTLQGVSNGYKYLGTPLDMRSSHKFLELSLGLYF